MSILTSATSRTGYGKHPRESRSKTAPRNHAFFFASTRGQHILKNPGIIKEMIDKSGIKETDVVLEVGPGTGNLTMQLLQKCKQVIAVEVDVRMVSELKKRVMGTEYEKKLTIIHGDAIKCKFPFFNLCIANIPYQISSPLIFKLLSHRPHFRACILMVQDEFARRLVARPGDLVWSRLSINCQLLARTSYIKKVGKHNFRPPPKVESAIVRIEPRRPVPPINFIEWDGMIRIVTEAKNRLLQKIFNNKNVLNTLYKNHCTFVKMRNIEVNNRIMSDIGSKMVNRDKNKDGNKDKNDINMSEDSKDSKESKENEENEEDMVLLQQYDSVEQMKRIIQAVLKESGLNEKRPRHLDITDFLRVLKLFNDNNIHFK